MLCILAIMKKNVDNSLQNKSPTLTQKEPSISIGGEKALKFHDNRIVSSSIQALQEKANEFTSQNTVQLKWIKDGEKPLRWDGVLDGIQWYQLIAGEDANKMYYVIIDPKKIKPSMLESYEHYQKTPMPREFWEQNSVFGDIYNDLDASIISPEEATGGMPLTPEWFGFKPESMKGQWLKRILETPFDAIEAEFRKYLEIVYSGNVVIETDEHIPIEGHIDKIIRQIKDAKNYANMLRPKANLTHVKAKMDFFIDRIVRQVPTIPDAGTKILGNIGDLRKDDETQGGTHKLIVESGQYFMVNRNGVPTPANGPFVFVVPVDTKEVLLGKRSDGGHTVISHGGDVYFAGQMELKAGVLEYWNNDSGHYRSPKEQSAVLAQIGLSNVLPMVKFKSIT